MAASPPPPTWLVLAIGIFVVWFISRVVQRWLQLHSFVSNPRVLILFSGGQDSAAALYKVLAETDLTVHAHHIILVDSQNRWYPELMACRRIVRWLQLHVRPFLYTENIYTNTTFVPNNMEIQRFVAGELSKIAITEHDPYRFIVSGRNATDNSGPEFERRSRRAHAIYDAMLRDVPFYLRAKFWFPVGEMRKEQVQTFLRTEAPAVYALTWSCRTPIFDNSTSYRPCGRCKTCVELLSPEERTTVLNEYRQHHKYAVNAAFIDQFVDTKQKDR